MNSLAKNTLGQTGIEVSCLGLGTVKIGRNEAVKYPEAFTLPDDAAVVSLLEKAQQLGINLLDTAPAYGSSEQRLGSLLTDRKSWVICSKVGEQFSQGKSRFDFSAAQVQRSIEQSLRNLRTDYLDIVLIHSDGNDEAILESSDCLATLLKLQQKGLLRACGMSTKTLKGGLLAVEQTDLVMVTYNPATIEDAEVIRAAYAKNKGVLIKKALMSGHLKNTTSKDPVLGNLQFIFSQPGVSSVIVGTINPAHLEANVAAAKKALETAG